MLKIMRSTQSKRLPGKNMKFLGNKPLIQYSIIVIIMAAGLIFNSDDKEIIEFGFSQMFIISYI